MAEFTLPANSKIKSGKNHGGANGAGLPSIGLPVNGYRRNRHQMIGAETVQEPQRQRRNRQCKKRHRDEL